MGKYVFKVIETRYDREIPEVDVLVAGFPGVGLVGVIASEQLINSLGLEQVASVACDDFPPTAVIFDGIPRRPVRFFAGQGFLLVKADMVIPSRLADGLAKTIIDWAVDKGVTEVIILDSIPSDENKEDEKHIWGVISRHEVREQAENLGIEVIKRGAISGITSPLLLYAHEKKLEAVAMLAEGKTNMPDPRASAMLLDKFSGYMELDIDTSVLIESAKELEEQYARLVNQTKQAQAELDDRSAQPPLYG